MLSTGHGAALALALIALGPIAVVEADTLKLANGTVLNGCYARDEGTCYTVWASLEKVGGPLDAYPRSRVESYTMERGPAWDRRPERPDLTVTHIELTPKLAGLHGRVQYDKFGRPSIGGDSKLLVDIGDEKYLQPERIVEHLKLKYEPGETITLTAHVKNVGFISARPFDYEWEIDGSRIGGGRFANELKEMEETTFSVTWPWQSGLHHVTFRIVTSQPEIAVINNTLTDPLWGWGFVYVVNPGRVAAWHEFRSAYGTFCFEDFYRWHIEIMNRLFAESVFPSAPDGIQARVRLDRIIYAEKPAQAADQLFGSDGIRYDQGLWVWRDSPEELESGKWSQVDHKWRNSTEWSLPHELGHQLGLIDWYNIDYHGDDSHVMADNGDKITHFQRYPMQMMHWHGPQVFGEADAGYLNMSWDKPRGHFGDVLFAIPRENFLRIVDVNGRGVAQAKVEIFQRGTLIDPEGAPGEDHGVRYFPVVEDGRFDHPVGADPVVVGVSDQDGVLRLPNRPVEEVRTLNGFHRRPNPFGNINVVGQRGLMLVRVTKHDRPCHYWLDVSEFVDAWFRGHKERYTVVLNAPYGSVDSPPPPTGVTVERINQDSVRVTWTQPEVVRQRNYLDSVIGYRVYRRISSDGLNDRPWFVVGTLGPNTTDCVVDLRERPEDVYWFSKAERFAVSSIAPLSIESELVETLLR